MLLVAWALQEASSAKHDATSGVVPSTLQTQEPAKARAFGVLVAVLAMLTSHVLTIDTENGLALQVPRVIEAITVLADAIVSTREEDDAHAICGKLCEYKYIPVLYEILVVRGMSDRAKIRDIHPFLKPHFLPR